METFNFEWFMSAAFLINILLFGWIIVILLSLRRKEKLSAQVISAEDVLQQLPGHVYWKDKEGILLGSNMNNWSDFGLKSQAELHGKTDYDLFPVDIADRVSKIDREIIESGEAKIIGEPSLHSDGTKKFYLSHKAPLRDRAQNIIGIVGISIDITDARNVSSSFAFELNY